MPPYTRETTRYSVRMHSSKASVRPPPLQGDEQFELSGDLALIRSASLRASRRHRQARRRPSRGGQKIFHTIRLTSGRSPAAAHEPPASVGSVNAASTAATGPRAKGLDELVSRAERTQVVANLPQASPSAASRAQARESANTCQARPTGAAGTMSPPRREEPNPNLGPWQTARKHRRPPGVSR